MKNKNILIIVTGSIATYKACEVIRLLRKKGAEVQVMMTQSSQKFVGITTFSALTNHEVITEMFPKTPKVGLKHIDMAIDLDAIVVVPATANILCKAANGVADEVVSTTLSICEQPTLFVPAMNFRMWQNPATMEAVEKLRSRGKKVQFQKESLDSDQLDNILSSITSMGKLPDGIYDFSIKLSNFSHSQSEIIESKSINITTPTSLNMIYPGGALMDTAQNLIYTPYPIFQWSTEICLTCELFIRVAEFDPELHSSLGEAIEDVTSLPIDQIEGWHNMMASTASFSYPVIGARDLEEGKLYVWQIKKELPTTSGTDAYFGPISVFKLADPSATKQEGFSTSTQVISEPILIALKELLGEDPFDAYFGNDGEFANFLLNGTYRINTETTTSNDILKIIDQLQQGTISVVSISVE